MTNSIRDNVKDALAQYTMARWGTDEGCADDLSDAYEQAAEIADVVFDTLGIAPEEQGLDADKTEILVFQHDNNIRRIP